MIPLAPAPPSTLSPPGEPPPVRAGETRHTGLRVLRETSPERESLLDKEALDFLVRLTRRFAAERDRILRERIGGAGRRGSGTALSPSPETRGIRESEWTVAAPPARLSDPRVILVGGVDAQALVRGLNSKASIFVADFEDRHSPTWEGTLQGHLNLNAAVCGDLEYNSRTGRRFRLVSRPAALMVRPRGWHLVEGHLQFDGRAVPASFFDFAMYVTHNARELAGRGSGPFLQLAGIEHYAEARLWADLFEYTEGAFGMARGSIRASVLLDSVTAAYEMDEILHALRFHSAGFAARRWGYLFSFIKHFRSQPGAILPERRALSTQTPIVASYYRQIVETCRRRDAVAIGELAVEPPPPDSPSTAGDWVRALDTEAREIGSLGFDGIATAHPALVPALAEWFRPERAAIGPALETGVSWANPELRAPPAGAITTAVVRANIRRSLRYLAAWLQGEGTVVVDGRAEDGVSVEFARAQLWQWAHPPARVSSGSWITHALVRELVEQEAEDALRGLPSPTAAHRAVVRSARLLEELVTDPEPVEYFALRAYNDLDRPNPAGPRFPSPER